ncbi:MAG: hypothetical protein KDB23_16820 [Planctomycetales bacterium]|nr:hypothetical protein [Planctomycetales bacterium]
MCRVTANYAAANYAPHRAPHSFPSQTAPYERQSHGLEIDADALGL